MSNIKRIEVGDKVFIDCVFKIGYVYNFDNIKNKYRVAVIENGINRYYDVNKMYLQLRSFSV